MISATAGPRIAVVGPTNVVTKLGTMVGSDVTRKAPITAPNTESSPPISTIAT